MNNKILLTLALSFILISSVSAAGIASPYWKDYPLQMKYGETKTINFNLQNVVGTESITVEVSLKQGSDIATLEKTTYTAAAGTSDTLIPLKISIPEDYSKSVQPIELEVKTISPEGAGMVTVSSGWTANFDVVISEPVADKENNFIYILIGLMVLVALLIVIITVIVKKRQQ